MNTDYHFNLLIVEDNEIIQRATKLLLMNLGCTVDIAADGETALKMVLQNHYDLIFMDIDLLGMDGFSTTRAIRQMRQGNVSVVPIIALTARLDEASKFLCFESGMNEFLTKPITRAKAQAILNQFIHRT